MGVYLPNVDMPKDDKVITIQILPDGSIWQQYRGIVPNAKAIPAADVRPVVLCKDCRHRDPEDHKCDSGETERQGCPFKVADNYFCAYGEE